jgi:hypothetical protein
VFDQRIDDLAEGRADNDTDREVDDITLEGKILELADQGEWLLQCFHW